MKVYFKEYTAGQNRYLSEPPLVQRRGNPLLYSVKNYRRRHWQVLSKKITTINRSDSLSCVWLIILLQRNCNRQTFLCSFLSDFLILLFFGYFSHKHIYRAFPERTFLIVHIDNIIFVMVAVHNPNKPRKRQVISVLPFFHNPFYHPHIYFRFLVLPTRGVVATIDFPIQRSA